ncbi:MAG TPA: hypothetical protein VNI54_11005 [Thermoanaerobaculia bacterium]|nr:hypothetical protein [Thermoanaerobaculia bacterium]
MTVGTGTYAGTAPDINWYGHAFYLNDAGEPGVGVGMSGNVSLFDSYSFTVGNATWSTTSGSWEGTYQFRGDWTICYYSAINARTFDQEAEMYGGSTCNPRPPLPPKDDIDLVDCPTSPIVIALGDGQYLFSGPEDPVMFDIDANGAREPITWTRRSEQVAFLAMDRNRNGAIDDGSELFGTAAPLRGGGVAANGFVALRDLDSNSDSRIDHRDGDWRSLLVWTDSNHDGVTQQGEIQSLADTSVIAISTSYGLSGRRDAFGNLLALRGYAELITGQRPIYDVYLFSHGNDPPRERSGHDVPFILASS